MLVHATASACNRLKRQFHSNSLPNHSVLQVCRVGSFSSWLARHFELPGRAIQEFEFTQSTICSYTKFTRNTQYSNASAIDGNSRIMFACGREGLGTRLVPCTAVVRVEARSMIFTMCDVIYGVIVGSRIRVVTQHACHAVGSYVYCESTTREYH